MGGGCLDVDRYAFSCWIVLRTITHLICSDFAFIHSCINSSTKARTHAQFSPFDFWFIITLISCFRFEALHSFTMDIPTISLCVDSHARKIFVNCALLGTRTCLRWSAMKISNAWAFHVPAPNSFSRSGPNTLSKASALLWIRSSLLRGIVFGFRMRMPHSTLSSPEY